MVSELEIPFHASNRMTVAQNYNARENLRDGRAVIIRAINKSDKPIMLELMQHLSAKSRYSRFFTVKDSLTDKELADFTELDFAYRVGLLAAIVECGSTVSAGTGRYVICKGKIGSRSAELSFAVKEEFQGLGIATLLLKHLAVIAKAAGIIEFMAFVLADNTKMLDVFVGSGLAMTQSIGEHGVIQVRLSLIG